MLQVTKIDPTSLATTLAVVGFFTGLILGFVAVLMYTTADSIIYLLPLFGAENMSIIARSVLGSLGPLSIVVFAFLFSLEGFIGGFAVALVYNIAAPKFGGVTFSIAEQAPAGKPALKEVKNENEFRKVVVKEDVPADEAQPGNEEGQAEPTEELLPAEGGQQGEDSLPPQRNRRFA